MKKNADPTILISRTDAIGDVILTLPVAGVLRKHFPTSRIIFLGRDYTEAVIRCESSIDDFISWDFLRGLPQTKQIQHLKDERIDIILHIFPSKEISRLAFKAGIRRRYGTSHRLYNLLYCNNLINLSRRHSPLHEAQLNLQLLRALLPSFVMPSVNDLPQYLNFKSTTPNPYFDLLKPDKFNLILHPASNGSGREWSQINYCRLITLLSNRGNFRIFVCGTQSDGQKIYNTIILPNKGRVIDLTGKMSLSQYISFISHADALIAAGTGPLHISAVLDCHTIGLFPPIRPMHPARWSPIGRNVKVFCEHHRCSSCKKHPENCLCMAMITPFQVASYLYTLLK